VRPDRGAMRVQHHAVRRHLRPRRVVVLDKLFGSRTWDVGAVCATASSAASSRSVRPAPPSTHGRPCSSVPSAVSSASARPALCSTSSSGWTTPEPYSSRPGTASNTAACATRFHRAHTTTARRAQPFSPKLLRRCAPLPRPPPPSRRSRRRLPTLLVLPHPHRCWTPRASASPRGSRDAPARWLMMEMALARPRRCS
jgi:hypothetical protein